MIGDSITDAGRSRHGESTDESLGYGYVSFVAALLGAAYPEAAVRVVNKGVSGNTALDLKMRWQKDVLDLTPDWLSIMIGINDVWGQFGSPYQDDVVYLNEYERILTELIGQTAGNLKGLILMTPYFIEPNQNEPIRVNMDLYGRKVRELAEKFNAVLIDTQAAFDSALRIYHPTDLSEDRVHPNNVGHMIIARAFLQGIDFVWS